MNKVTHYVQHDFNTEESETNKIIKMSKSLSKITFNISDLFQSISSYQTTCMKENYSN